jgi:beta-glucosidase/6-phospho-beta-glucosidase/beta-galactosidase
MLPPRSQLARLLEPEAFVWATGIEDTFITAPWPRTGRTLDEYELTGHYDRWRDDLALIPKLGLGVARYGVPWHRIQPQPDRWDWSWAEGPLERMLELGVDPIVDLIHYGLPPWLRGAYLDPDFPARAAEFAGRLAERFRGRVRWWTPLNEPRITAWYCGKLGWWPPSRRGWRGFVEVMLAVCRGITAVSAAIRAADPGNVLCHVDATDLYESDDATLSDEVERRQEIVFLALDLVSGRVGPEHPLRPWLGEHGVDDAALSAFLPGVDLDVIGINLYPLFSRKVLKRSARGLRVRMPYADASIIERLGELYWRRYGRPVLITETATLGTVSKRMAWLASSLAAVRRLRERGVPLVGYTWWPLYALVTWAYRQGRLPPERYLAPMGLYELDGPRLVRRATAAAEVYREHALRGAAVVGALAPSEEVLHVR